MIEFMNNINYVLEFIDGSFDMEEFMFYKLEDLGEYIQFSIQKGKYNIPVEEIVKIGEDSLRLIYAAIAAKYERQMEIGSTMDYKNGQVTWHLAPVLRDKLLVQFSSPYPKDQEWFYQELERNTKQKGLK